MPPENEETPPAGTEETPPAGDETPPGDQENEETPPGNEEPQAPEMTLEDAKAEVTKTRAEAANYRVRAREAEEKLKSAKTLEEVEEIVSRMTVEREAAERSLLVENVALKFDLPEALAARLQGATREELEADAKSLQSFVQDTAKPKTLTGGLTPNETDGDEPSDPRELARKYGRRGTR